MIKLTGNAGGRKKLISLLWGLMKNYKKIVPKSFSNILHIDATYWRNLNGIVYNKTRRQKSHLGSDRVCSALKHPNW